MTEAGGGATTNSGSEPGALARMAGVLFSPGKTFESVARKPGWDWLVPVLLLMGLTIIGGIYINPKLDTDAAVKDTMKRIDARGNLSDAQKEQIKERVEKQFAAVKSGWIRFLGPCFVLIPLIFVPLFYFWIAKAFGAAKTYVPIVAGYAYCQVPQLLKGIVGLGVAFPRESIDLNDAERIVRSSIGAFLDSATTSKALLTFMTSIDLFEIWGLVLGSIMLARTTRLSKNLAAIAVISLWLVYVLLKVAGAALGSAFGG
jgi:hypothetical protein